MSLVRLVTLNVPFVCSGNTRGMEDTQPLPPPAPVTAAVGGKGGSRTSVYQWARLSERLPRECPNVTMLF